ncbi:MAG: hypothetical protein ISS93_03425 [Candidatus Aenigmarchaeota archaeon]|nr:hypothetical protein [Candidatus Aenigmarchaeota archaeon]
MNPKILWLLAFLIPLAAMGLSQGQPSAHSMQINLTLNTIEGTIYVPGSGEDVAGNPHSTSPTSPPHFYLAHYSNNTLTGLVFSQEIPLSISSRTDTDNTYLSLEQNLTHSQAFLVFTSGDYEAIDNRMELIEKGTFLQEISPSFSFSLGTKNPVKLLLNYTSIDIQGNFTFRKGYHEITLESNRTGTRKILVINETL